MLCCGPATSSRCNKMCSSSCDCASFWFFVSHSLSALRQTLLALGRNLKSVGCPRSTLLPLSLPPGSATGLCCHRVITTDGVASSLIVKSVSDQGCVACRRIVEVGCMLCCFMLALSGLSKIRVLTSGKGVQGGACCYIRFAMKLLCTCEATP